jgi:hypothetical protein
MPESWFRTPGSSVRPGFAKCRLSLFAEMGFMAPELMFWFALATKMVITALFVSVATIVAERLGATVGALVATLPVSAGPVYVFLASITVQLSFL